MKIRLFVKCVREWNNLFGCVFFVSQFSCCRAKRARNKITLCALRHANQPASHPANSRMDWHLFCLQWFSDSLALNAIRDDGREKNSVRFETNPKTCRFWIKFKALCCNNTDGMNWMVPPLASTCLPYISRYDCQRHWAFVFPSECCCSLHLLCFLLARTQGIKTRIWWSRCNMLGSLYCHTYAPHRKLHMWMCGCSLRHISPSQTQTKKEERIFGFVYYSFFHLRLFFFSLLRCRFCFFFVCFKCERFCQLFVFVA